MNAFLSEERGIKGNSVNVADDVHNSSSIEASSSAQDSTSSGSNDSNGGIGVAGGGGRAARIKTYTVVPLSPEVGVMEWVQNTIPIGNYLTDKSRSSPGAHSRY